MDLVPSRPPTALLPHFLQSHGDFFFFFSLFLHRLLHCIDIALLALHHLFAVTERYKYIYIYKYDIYIFKFYRARPAVLRSHEEEVCECLFFFLFFFLSIKL